MYEIVKNSEPLQEIAYCISKHGAYGFQPAGNVARLIQQTKTFVELKWLLILIFGADSTGFLSEDAFESALQGADIKNHFPTLDRLRRWPWDEGYEV